MDTSFFCFLKYLKLRSLLYLHYYLTKKSFHIFNTRDKNKLCIPRHNLHAFSSSFTIKAARLWNTRTRS